MGCGGIFGSAGWGGSYAAAIAGFSLDEMATLQTVMYTNAAGRIIGFGLQVMGEIVEWVAVSK